MAKKGNNFREIIQYYYTGVDIKEFELPCKRKPLINKMFVIDPGHGGEESIGIIGQRGLMEKDVVLSIAKGLKEELEALGATVKLTREEDIYVSLKKRAELSNTHRPDFFISLHMNSFGNSNISGAEVYYYRGDREGEILGNFIIEKLSKNMNIVNRGVKQSDFYLLKEVKNSSLHIELD